MNKESDHENVYGKTFSLYNVEEMNEFIAFFKKRFEINDIDPIKLFQNKKVLDAGCGNGRGAIFSLLNGANSVDIVDVSETNIKTTIENVGRFNLTQPKPYLGTLEKLPFEDEVFDVVWCNGVIMHTANPDKCLCELSRVLKINGYAWIYVYGSGGIYWKIISLFRDILHDVTSEKCISILQNLGYSSRYIAEYIDDWKVPYLRTYTNNDFSRRLTEIGFENVKPLNFGVNYDTSQRKSVRPEEACWWGEGDLRYLVKKVNKFTNAGESISDSVQGSQYSYSDNIEQTFSGVLRKFKSSMNGGETYRVKACANIQFHLRKIMDQNKPLNIPEILKLFE